MDGHDINSLRGTKAVDPAADRYTAVVHRRSEAQEHPRGQAGRQTRYGIFSYKIDTVHMKFCVCKARIGYNVAVIAAKMETRFQGSHLSIFDQHQKARCQFWHNNHGLFWSFSFCINKR